ncbi:MULTISPECIES: ATP-binding protein [Calditerrivibrio]|jgi:two-component system sensor histidine kinase HydH|uniref:histidine kinase n=1 Tax=Calditerrivibrio nitroreducens TaxID=477976 RepID=A0A2J6WH55_9BACT|nr:MAG: hypothetical protein C0187_06395 [Calditerrivibrio nitroreducens]
MKKLITSVNILIVISVILLLILGYYEIKKYNVNVKTHKKSLVAQGELSLKVLEGAPKYFGSIRSISVVQLAEELAKNENILGIIIFTEDEVIYKSTNIKNIDIKIDSKKSFYETDKEIVINRLLNPEDMIDPKLKNKLSSNFAPLYYATVVLSKSEFNHFVSSAQKDIFIIFISIIFVILLLIFIRIMIKRYEIMSMELTRSKQMEEIANFANILAHEIKNPLSSIQGFSNYVYDNIKDEELKDYMDRLLDELDRLKLIVDDFNQFGRPIDIKRSNFSIKKLIDRCVDLVKYDAEKKNLTFEITGEDFEISADQDKILQVLLNLFINAIRYSKQSSKIEIKLNDKMIKIINQNDNKEIDKEKLFTPFYTTSSKGSGLGLAICKKIMTLHGFAIFVDKIDPFVIVLDFNERR